MLTLCPDHPQAATVQANIDAAGAADVSENAQAQAIADGKYAEEGKHLVGSEVKPGTWQSVGNKVTDCYWEISDESGNIIDNSFISIAPQFTISIPASASGLSKNGCAFHWISE